MSSYNFSRIQILFYFQKGFHRFVRLQKQSGRTCLYDESNLKIKNKRGDNRIIFMFARVCVFGSCGVDVTD